MNVLGNVKLMNDAKDSYFARTNFRILNSITIAF